MFNSMYYTLKKFKKIDELIVAYDDKNSWRKVIYKNYKGDRVKDEEIDWEKFYQHYYSFLQDIKRYLPIKVIFTPRAEADDIIGVLSLNKTDEQEILIISSDSDYKQLSDYADIYDPLKRKTLEYANPEEFLTKLYLKGQKKDNIQNVKTPNDWPTQYKRRPALGDKTIEKILNEDKLEEFLDTSIEHKFEYEDEDGKLVEYKAKVKPREKYELNKRLIDFREIPKVIKRKTLERYNEYEIPDPDHLYTFFKKYNWPTYLENYEEVENYLLRLY